MRSRSGPSIALVVAGAMTLATPYEVRATAPQVPEGETSTEDEGKDASDADSVEAPAEDRETRMAEASRRYRDGQDLFEQQQYAAAAEAFERSYAAIPAPSTLYNIAVSHELADHPIPAIMAYERYLGAGEIPSEEREEVDSAITRQRAKVGELELPEGVKLEEVRVDGETIEDFPLLVMPGSVTVEVVGTKKGERLERTYQIRPGDRRTIDVVFAVPTPEPAPETVVDDDPPRRPPPVDRKAERRRQALKKVFWGGVAVTAASGVAIGVFGGLERRGERLFEGAKCEDPCPEDEDGNPSKPYPFTLEERYLAYQTATNVMIGVTCAFAIATLVLGLRAYRKDPRSGRRARAPSVRLIGSNLVVRW